MEDATPAEEVELVNTFMYYGLEKVGFSRKQIDNSNERLCLQRFVSFFGVCPKTCKEMFSALKEVEPFRVKCSMVHFFLTLAWLKSYGTYSVLSGQFKVTENTVMKWVWIYAKGIQSLKESKVRRSRKTCSYFLYFMAQFVFSFVYFFYRFH